MTDITKYVQRLKKLRSDASPSRWSFLTLHRAPHKPLLLLAVMDMFAEGNITSNKIEVGLELGELFTIYWSKVMPPDQRGNLALPFYHLTSDTFWHLQAQPSKETILTATRQIRSLSQLQELVQYAYLDEELYAFFCDEEKRNLLRAVLIETYFASEVQNVLVEQGSINVEAYQYSQELLAHARTQQTKEGLVASDIYRPAVRDQGFRRAIITSYEHRCALCGLRILTADGHSAIDAAHIVPWSVTHNDDPRNGMALCKLCHWSFDEGLLTVSSKYTVMVSPQMSANQNTARHLLTLADQKIAAPTESLLWPDLEALDYHRTSIFRVR